MAKKKETYESKIARLEQVLWSDFLEQRPVTMWRDVVVYFHRGLPLFVSLILLWIFCSGKTQIYLLLRSVRSHLGRSLRYFRSVRYEWGRFALAYPYLCRRQDAVRQSLRASPHDSSLLFLSLTQSQIGCASENRDQVPVFSRLSLSLTSPG